MDNFKIYFNKYTSKITGPNFKNSGKQPNYDSDFISMGKPQFSNKK